MVESASMPDSQLLPDASNLVTEDDTPVDNFASAKQQRLLAGTLYSAIGDRVFLAEANVGIYHTVREPAIVPDVFLSIGVRVPENWWEKQNRCYLLWQFGKPPEVAIEIVSNRQGDELDRKLHLYERMRVSYYVVFDPGQNLGESILYVYELRGARYVEMVRDGREMQPVWLEQVELGLTLWDGDFEGSPGLWLRWCDRDGTVLPTGDERARDAEERARRAERQAQRMAAQLQALGIEPDTESGDEPAE